MKSYLLLSLLLFAPNVLGITANPIIHTCLWKADQVAGSLQAIKFYPHRSMAEHRRHLVYLFEQENKPYWYVEAVLKIFQETLENVSPHSSVGELFKNSYNECVRQSKEDLENGVKYPELTQPDVEM